MPFRRHFGAIEAGVRLEMPEIVACFHRDQVRPPSDTGHFGLADLPTLSDLEQLICRSKGSKAPGPCGIPEWLWKYQPPSSAKSFHCIAIKGHLCLAEPIQVHQPDHPFQGQGFCQPTRGLPWHLSTRRSWQNHLGTLPGNLISISQHEIRSYARIASQQGLPCGTLFVDATAAYYRVLGESLFRPVKSDAELCHILHALGVARSFPGSSALGRQYCLAPGHLSTCSKGGAIIHGRLLFSRRRREGLHLDQGGLSSWRCPGRLAFCLHSSRHAGRSPSCLAGRLRPCVHARRTAGLRTVHLGR